MLRVLSRYSESSACEKDGSSIESSEIVVVVMIELPSRYSESLSSSASGRKERFLAVKVVESSFTEAWSLLASGREKESNVSPFSSL